MKEELTTAMHAEFTISKQFNDELRALSLLERERDGIPVTDEKLESYGFTRKQFQDYKLCSSLGSALKNIITE